MSVLKTQEANQVRSLEDWGRKIKDMITNTSGVILDKERQLQSLSGNLADDNDSATQSEMRRLASAELFILQQKRRDLSEALNRVASGDFGYCDDCGAEIPLGRLESKPESPFCVACLEVVERQQMHYRQRRIA